MLIQFARNYAMLGDTGKQSARANEAHRLLAGPRVRLSAYPSTSGIPCKRQHASNLQKRCQGGNVMQLPWKDFGVSAAPEAKLDYVPESFHAISPPDLLSFDVGTTVVGDTDLVYGANACPARTQQRVLLQCQNHRS